MIGMSIQLCKYSKLTKNKEEKSSSTEFDQLICTALLQSIFVMGTYMSRYTCVHGCEDVSFSSFFHFFLCLLTSSNSLLLHAFSETIQGKQHLSFLKMGEEWEPFVILTRQIILPLKDMKSLRRQLFLINLKRLFNISSCNEF